MRGGISVYHFSFNSFADSSDVTDVVEALAQVSSFQFLCGFESTSPIMRGGISVYHFSFNSFADSRASMKEPVGTRCAVSFNSFADSRQSREGRAGSGRPRSLSIPLRIREHDKRRKDIIALHIIFQFRCGFERS